MAETRQDGDLKFSFRAKLWKYPGHAGWHFVTVPKSLSKRIRYKRGLDEEGWGRLKAIARIGKSEWDTSIWHDTRVGGYLLPVKALVRKAEGIAINDRVTVTLVFQSIDWRTEMDRLYSSDG